MTGKDKFFFEEDPKADDSGVTWEEHSQTFFNVLEKEGVKKQEHSLEPMKPEVEMKMQELKNGCIQIEHGIFRDNYAVHVTPINPRHNLNDKKIFQLAIKKTVEHLNTVIPFDLSVKITLPQPEWEIKATSYVIEGGATAWNLDHKALEELMPKILKDLTDLCMKR